MATSPDIKCCFCGYQFKTYGIMEEHYEEYEKYKEMRYYPDPSENAHSLSGYTCDKCYQKFPEIIKQQILESGRKYIADGVAKEVEQAHKEYLEKVAKIEKAMETLEDIIEQVEKAPRFMDLSEEVQKYLHNGCGKFYIKGAYEVDKVIKWERENLLNQRSLTYWEHEYKLKIDDYPEYVEWGAMVTEQEFLDMLLDCKVRDKTTRDIMNILKSKNK